MQEHFDVVIIGAGMSGLAAGIRLAMFDKKVCILEKHAIPGGLNSYYNRGGFAFDVGLHAMTNFVAKGERAKPLTKLLKQLRISYEEFQLFEQTKSKILFPSHQLSFNNNCDLLRAEIAREFPTQSDAFEKLLKVVAEFNELDLQTGYCSAKDRVAEIIRDPALLEMIFCPLLIYGSAWQDDMDFAQFVIMFKSIFLEGFSRPKGGVRTIIDLLVKKFTELGGDLRFRSGIEKIECKNNSVRAVHLKRQSITADKIFSSAGLPETLSMLTESVELRPRLGEMTFCESIFLFKEKPKDFAIEETIIFYNNRPAYEYRVPRGLCDLQSAVICLPNNFLHDDYAQGVVRLTNIANYRAWQALERSQYKLEKEKLADNGRITMQKIFPTFKSELIYKDIFTPTTIKKFTGHTGGAVYGCLDKSRDGTTPIAGLYICGTDQGFLGIVGSMLSGISMANLHGLMTE